MAQAPKATILDHFAELDDPRVERTRHRKLLDIPAIAICGADSWVHIELFSSGKTARRSFARAGKKGAIHIRSLANRVPGPPSRP